jgi:hypothetical protein
MGCGWDAAADLGGEDLLLMYESCPGEVEGMGWKQNGAEGSGEKTDAVHEEIS